MGNEMARDGETARSSEGQRAAAVGAELSGMVCTERPRSVEVAAEGAEDEAEIWPLCTGTMACTLTAATLEAARCRLITIAIPPDTTVPHEPAFPTRMKSNGSLHVLLKGVLANLRFDVGDRVDVTGIFWMTHHQDGAGALAFGKLIEATSAIEL